MCSTPCSTYRRKPAPCESPSTVASTSPILRCSEEVGARTISSGKVKRVKKPAPVSSRVATETAGTCSRSAASTGCSPCSSFCSTAASKGVNGISCFCLPCFVGNEGGSDLDSIIDDTPSHSNVGPPYIHHRFKHAGQALRFDRCLRSGVNCVECCFLRSELLDEPSEIVLCVPKDVKQLVGARSQLPDRTSNFRSPFLGNGGNWRRRSAIVFDSAVTGIPVCRGNRRLADGSEAGHETVADLARQAGVGSLLPPV